MRFGSPFETRYPLLGRSKLESLGISIPAIDSDQRGEMPQREYSSTQLGSTQLGIFAARVTANRLLRTARRRFVFGAGATRTRGARPTLRNITLAKVGHHCLFDRGM